MNPDKVNHYMFDLETLGNNSQAPIVQIAAVEFDLDGNCLREFNNRIFLNYNFNDFKADISTIEWWLTQSDRSRQLVFGKDLARPRVDIRTALNAFNTWLIRSNSPKKFWSHATFDPPILNNAFLQMEMKSEMGYRDFMDIRTLNFLVGDLRTETHPPRESFGEHHDALADCKFQASYVAAMLRELKKRGEKNGPEQTAN